ncbi:MAG: diacylglycerol kinase family protein [Cyclobacteriaceae bacterium]
MKGLRAGKKNAIIVLNGISLKKKLFYHEYLPVISQLFNVEVHETLSRNDAKTLASRFTDKYVDVILAAGGDGTLHQVVNGILRGREDEKNLPAISVIPIGSGNDFARGAGLKMNIENTAKILSAFEVRPVDVGLVEFSLQPSGETEKGSAYFINVADIGMGPEVVGKVLRSGRPFGSEVAYYKSILNTFLTYKPMVVKATTPQWRWEGKLRTMAVANGQYYGHGLCIAPDAVMDDRMFSVFICGNVSVFDFIMHTGTLKKGKPVIMDEVLYKTTTSIEFSSERPCSIEGDGEILGWLPAKVKMIERQLNFLI